MTPEEIDEIGLKTGLLERVGANGRIFHTEASASEVRAAIRAIEAATIERLAAWIEPQRNDVPATGKEFAAAIRAIAKKEGT